VISLIAVLLAFAGCGKSDTETTSRNWKTGTKGLEMKFQQGSPPSSVYDGDRIDFVLELWNRGAYPLMGDLYLTGYDPSIFTGLREVTPISILDTKTQYNPEGGFKVIPFEGRVHVPQGVDSFKTTFNAYACYSYETDTAIQVCIDPEPGKNDATDPCKPGAYDVGTQAAPVAVTSVDVESTPSRAIFRIKIKNVGSGTIVDEALIRHCIDPDVTFADANWIDLLEAWVGNEQYLQCEPSNPIKLPDGSGSITCWLTNQGTQTIAYTTTLNLRIAYGYKDVLSTSVEARSSI
jgi:hypothetical protein